MGERMVGIRQLAREAGVSSKTLRYWETRGLLPPPRRTHTNYRLYGETDLERVLFIRKAQSLGLTLARSGRSSIWPGPRRPPATPSSGGRERSCEHWNSRSGCSRT